MENASKALIIAGSLLISLAVIALLVYTFDRLGVVEEEQDKIQAEESVIAFNKEFDAFNKKLMYGVDVMSCINKAINKNINSIVFQELLRCKDSSLTFALR